MKSWRYSLFVPISYIILTIVFNIIKEDKDLLIPVVGATTASWDNKSYWYYPWGNSKVHKGIDIFASQKTPIVSPINGIVLSTSYNANGGNYIEILGPKLRIYYFAHLNTREVRILDIVEKGKQIGTVGNSGNAITRPYHLHFSIFSLVPIFRNYNSNEYQGWKKMFYLNPNKSLFEKYK